jgi:DNA-binding MarR family transcriptional regulator
MSFPVVPEPAPIPGAEKLDALLATKLWRNPCWFSFRINNLALQFNGAVYGWIEAEHGLLRPDFVVLYSVGLQDGTAATEIARSSGFPRNTLSRATQKLFERQLIRRELDPHDGRSYVLRLTEAGRQIYDDAMVIMREREELMLATLTPGEQHILYELLAKAIVDSPNWPATIPTSSRPSTPPKDYS